MEPEDYEFQTLEGAIGYTTDHRVAALTCAVHFVYAIDVVPDATRVLEIADRFYAWLTQ